MKKVFLLLASCVLVAGLALSAVSCDPKVDPDDPGGLIDDPDGPDKPDTPTDNTPASLKGSNYYVIAMDGITFDKIADKVALDLRPDDVTKFLYVWNGYAGATADGLNFYGNTEGYTSLEVTEGAGWSGLGYFIQKATPGFEKLNSIGSGYYLHFAYQGAANVTHCLYPAWGGKEYRMSVGGGAKFVDNGAEYDFLKPISNNGSFVANEWNEYEIAIPDTGLDYTAAPAEDGGQNVFCALSGGVAGTKLQFDAVFIYKK